ncbi:MAG: hypothetical protein II506_09290 [Lachnospiraceae bacterium]|nr:hypothetical protein [Lachnospiraceae bacterium]MBQ2467946.1 hypothetical protein [Lachnospiraceae bacterium]MBQ2533456.1 hypothetical protein [Lachnospiraceae bacterium]MBQ5386322.1 hypothetical protein [Lachnospiraceae bacterium]
MDELVFKAALKSVKVPVLVLDQKWHRLFAISGKPESVKEKEVELNELLQLQGKLNQEIKDLKAVKNKLMQGIVVNMDGANGAESSADHAKKLDDNKRLIEETNERLAADEDQLLDIPRSIKEVNEELMMLTMSFCYEKLRINANEIQEISDWITNVRVELKKNIIKKQNREINNKEIYSYMHDIFGRDVINLFDVKYEEEQKAKASEETITVAPTVAPSPKKEKVQPTENFDA